MTEFLATTYPRTRLRRNRTGAHVRRLTAEHHLRPDDLLQPVFVIEGGTEPVPHLDGIERMGIDPLCHHVEKAQGLGIPGVLLFSSIPPEKRDAKGSEAVNPDGIIPRAVRALRARFPEMMLIADAALDCYTDHGHDGLIDDHGRVLNDETCAVLARQALVLAEAGCDTISPSDMMDGRIGILRAALDDAGFPDVRLMSYACKYASGFYGPFRDAVGSRGLLTGDKRGYQMDPANTDEALHEAAMDIAEGADMLIVKPGQPCLDVLHRVKQTFAKPTFGYQVSGEYAMLRLAANAGVFDWQQAMTESLLGFKRAGADGIITYAATEVAAWCTPKP